MNISEAKSRSLDWMVAVALDLSPIMKFDVLAKSKMAYTLLGLDITELLEDAVNVPLLPSEDDYTPLPYFSSEWSDGGIVIDNFILELKVVKGSGGRSWAALAKTDRLASGYGETPLIAAMRAVCNTLLPEEVSIPLDLLKLDTIDTEVSIEEFV